MKIREYIAKIGENKKIEDMQELGDMLAEIIYKMKESHPELYDKYKMKLYKMAYGYTFTDEMAEKIVANMQPYHTHWTKEQTTQVMKDAGLKYDDNTWFIVLNMAYNDYHELFDDNLDMYIGFAKMFIDDPDAKPHKVFDYFMD